ncbi:class I SAM-dependent methyltransferase [Crocosphaera sp. XPORK-15E]|uniref:class I SAM-dependent methyltransferase n=1 Tax=Crocosphaera sp. XPORK-15E TaxID=3110247 RepID=UPI002B210632|nr:class I SAM-dependent methyltransferase [Crocosphaera sp. XPORK-15E]MEA5535512.1 class I SAM-dependent methyltransferase [Crocosphaera sp. XPORK-15E]
MTATTFQSQPNIASRLVNGILSIKPLAKLAKYQARSMMINRAEKIGVPWRENVRQLRTHDWEKELANVQNPNLVYPDYYLRSFHAYDKGNLSWESALEVESAACAVHASIWPGAGVNGDPRLRQNYHEILKQQLPFTPQEIVDLGCSVGMSTFPLQQIYPQAQITGVDLSPYHLAVAQYRSQQRDLSIKWLHAEAESTGLPETSFDLVSTFLLYHELPQKAAKAIFQEAYRLLQPGGYFTMMDMNPRAEAYQKMPPYILTLLKSTEPYLDEYFSLDIETALRETGFESPKITPISPRHRAIVARVKK